MQADSAILEIFEDFGVTESNCGYCQAPGKTSISHGMWAHAMSVDAYQELLNRGWRRSGRWIYKPDDTTCCPQYTIRLDVNRCSPTKAQRRIKRKMEQSTADSNSRGGSSRGSSPATGSPASTRPAPSGSRQHQAAAAARQSSSAAAVGSGVLTDAIDAAVTACVQAGTLPAVSYASSCVHPTTPKQQRHLARDVRVTSPVAMAVAGTARKVQPRQQEKFTAGAVADMLTSRLNDGLLPDGWRVHGMSGHLNFAGPASCAEAAAPSQSPAQPQPQLQQHAQQAEQPAQQEQPRQPVSGQRRNQKPGRQPAKPANGSSTALVYGSSAALAEAGELGELRRVRVGKRRSFNSLDGASPASSTDQWQMVEGGSPVSGASPMSISGAPLLRSSSMAAVNSADASHIQMADSPGSPPSSLAAPNMWGAQSDRSAPSEGAMVPARESKRSRLLQVAATSGASTATNAAAADPAASDSADHQHAAAAPDSTAARSGDATENGGVDCTAQKLIVRMVPSSPALVQTEFSLYRDYQVQQHGDNFEEVTQRQFERFLVDSPLQHQTRTDASGADEPFLGTFHMQYWLGRCLIAVSVVDVLPRCLSSVYMFWDKRYAHLSPGKYSVIREVDWVRAAAAHTPALHYLYLGYYIHGNPKMAYKADFQPCDLLCPRTLCWVPHTRVRSALDSLRGYADLAAIPGALTGLGAEHGVGADGSLAGGDLQADEAAVLGGLLMLIGGDTGRQLVRLGQLLDACVLGQGEADALLKRARAVHRVVGPDVGRRELILVVTLAS